MHRLGRRFVVAAKGQVGKETMALANSIGYNVDMIVGRPKLTVFADNEIAYVHHEGSRPHAIAARNGQALRFSASGRMVYARSVLHPGTRPNRFLSDNLYLAKG